MNNSKKLLSLLLALVMVFLVACGGPQGGDKTTGETTTETSPSTAETKAEGNDTASETESFEPKELKIAGGNDMGTMDYLVSSKSADNIWSVNFVETLLDYNNVGQLVGSLAETWEATENNTVWTFNLRKGVQWVDHQENVIAELTAEDFVTGLRHVADFDSQTSWIVSGTVKGLEDYIASDKSDDAWSKVGVEAVDKYTVRYTLTKPTPYFADIATYVTLMPLNKEFLESKGEGCKLGAPDTNNCSFGSTTPDSILYNGAFILESFDSKSQLVIKKNNHFWDKDNVQLTKVTEIYDDGQNPYSIKSGFESGTYPSFALRSSWSDYDQIAEQYKEYTRKTLPNSTTFGIVMNFNRQSFEYTNYATDEVKRENTKKALRNENFRKALRAAADKVAILAATAPLDVAKDTVRNINNFPTVGTVEGKGYFEVVQEEYNKNTGESRDLSDGQDAFLSKDEALKYIEAAKAEGIEFPVHLDYPVIETSDPLMKRASSFVQSVKENTDGQILIEIVAKPDKEVFQITYYNQDPAGSDYDISTFSGWNPDYNDPSSFTGIFTNVGGNMKSSGLGTFNEDGTPADAELKAELGFDKYNELYEEANAITDDHDARYKAFAKVDAFLLEKALFIPTAMRTRLVLVSKIKPFTVGYSEVGLTKEKFKYVRLLDEVVTTAEYEAAKAEWEKKVEEAAKAQ